LEAVGLATVVKDVERLGEVVAGRDHTAAPVPGPDLSSELREALDDLIGSAAARSHSKRVQLG
jgi:hypothetical protein